MSNYGDDILERITLKKFLDDLDDPQEREILHLWAVQEHTWEEIGKIIGEKYKGKPLTGSVMRYHRDNILAKLRQRYIDEG